MTSSLSKQCGLCLSRNAAKLCSRCKSILYCSRKCQSDHWPSHKKQCKKSSSNKQKESFEKNEKKETKSFAMNIQQRYEKEKRKQKKTKLNIVESINGITKFQILNDFLINNIKLLQFEFKYYSNNDSKWKYVYFQSNKVNKSGHFWIRMRLFLYSYKVKCKIRAKYDNDNKWFEWSKHYVIIIPSSLVSSKCKVGDYIKYRPKNEFYANGRGTVLEMLDDDFLKIKRYKNSEYNKECIIHCNQLSTTRISSTYLTEIIDDEFKWIPEKRFILQNDDNNVLNIYTTLCNIYHDYATLYNPYTTNMFTTLNGTYDDVGKYVAGNIIRFLYSPQYVWKIGCRLNDGHGLLELCNLMNHFTVTNIKSTRLGINNGVKADCTSEWCDICHVSSNRFMSTFHCNAPITESHDYCIKCINGMITKHNQLQLLLDDILVEDINHNCIQIIVTFVIGKVVKVYR